MDIKFYRQEIVVASLILSILWREKGPTWWQVSLESKLITFLFLGRGGGGVSFAYLIDVSYSQDLSYMYLSNLEFGYEIVTHGCIQ